MDFSDVFKLDEGLIDRYKNLETDILTTCSEKNLMAIWSQDSSSILLTSYAKVNRKSVPQLQKLVTNPIVEVLVTNLVFNHNGDHILLMSESAVFYVRILNFNEGNKSIIKLHKVIETKHVGIRKAFWITNKRIAIATDFEIMIFELENEISKFSHVSKIEAVCWSEELEGFIFVDSTGKVFVKNSVSATPQRLEMYPELNSFDSSKRTEIITISWLNSTVYAISNSNIIYNCVLVEDDECSSQVSQLEEKLLLWAYETLQTDNCVDQLHPDNLVSNKFYLVSKQDIYTITIPTESDQASDGSLPAAIVTQILQTKVDKPSKNQKILGLTATDTNIYIIFEGSLFQIPKIRHLIDFDSTQSEHDISIENSSFVSEIRKILARDSSQPALCSKRKSSPNPSHDDCVEMAGMLQTAIKNIKSQYLDKQKNAKEAILTREKILAEKCDILESTVLNLKQRQLILKGDAEVIGDKLNDFLEKQDEINRRLKKIRRFTFQGEKLSRAEKNWLTEASKYEQMLVSYKSGMNALKDKLHYQHKNNKSVSEPKSDLKNSLQFVDVEAQIFSNTAELEDLVESLKKLTVQTGVMV